MFRRPNEKQPDRAKEQNTSQVQDQPTVKIARSSDRNQVSYRRPKDRLSVPEQQSKKNMDRWHFYHRRCVSKVTVRRLLIIVGAVAVAVFTFSTEVSVGKCNENSASEVFECPGQDEVCPDRGISLVSNCLDCPNHHSTYFAGKQCFERKLLNGKANPNPSYLWRDIIGIVVWFLAAGVATAAGVGGGGIYVPVGILLLAFAPKPSSGLSQASIFGASLGGLLLNLRDKHPFTTKVEGTTNACNPTTLTPGSNCTSLSQGSRETAPMQHEEVITCVSTQGKTPNDTTSVRYFTRPLIDYDMALFLAPMEMAGAVLGVLIQKILPNWLYLLLSSVILGYTATKTYSKWWSVHTKERAEHASPMHLDGQVETNNHSSNSKSPSHEYATIELQHDETSTYETSTALSLDEQCQKEGLIHVTDNVEMVEEAHQSSGDHGNRSSSVASSEGHENRDEAEASPPALTPEQITRRTELLKRDARQLPTEKLFTFAILWTGLTLLTFLKGGKGVESLIGITCEDTWYGVLIGLQFVWTFGFAAFFGWKLMIETNEKQSVQYPFHPQDVLWDFEKTRFYAFFTFFAGIVAGLIGIGGGMVLGPLMLVMGIHPRVSTATTATMVVLTSSSVALLFVTSGLVPWEYSVCFFLVCFCGALVGKFYIDEYVKRTGRASILVFLLATIIAFATIGTLVIIFIRLSEAHWCFDGFNQFCKPPVEDDEVKCETSEHHLPIHLQYGKDFYSNVISQ